MKKYKFTPLQATWINNLISGRFRKAVGKLGTRENKEVTLSRQEIDCLIEFCPDLSNFIRIANT